MKIRIAVETPLIIGGSDDMLEFDFFQESGHLKAIDLEATASVINEADALKWQNHIRNLITLKGIPGRSLQRDQSGTGAAKVSEIMTFYQNLARTGTLKTFTNEIELGGGDFWRFGGVTPTLYHITQAQSGRLMEPYIPGSSVKGAIRRSVLFDLIGRGQFIVSEGRNAKASDLILENVSGFNDRHAFEDSPVFRISGKSSPQNDLMRFITVSDFIPDGKFTLSLVQLSRKTGTREQKSNYLAVTSGKFTGDISLNRSILLQGIGGKLKSDDYRNLASVLNVSESDIKGISGESNSAFARVEEKIVKYLIEKVTGYAVINGEISGYDVEGRHGIIILGFGKGSPLNTVLNANSSFSAEALRKLTAMRKRNPKAIASPKTKWVVQWKGGESRPGLCTMEVIS